MDKKFFLPLILLIITLTLSACSNEQEKSEGGDFVLEQLKAPENGEEIAILETNHGVIKIRLFDDIAPKAVENFKTHAGEGYYNGVTFHRVIEDFMIQGGDPDGTGMGGESIWGEPFEDEFDLNYRNFRGALSMANAGPGTNGSQFFIVQADSVPKEIIDQMREAGADQGYPEDVVDAYEKLGGTYHLDGNHTVFGQVFEGMDIVDKIAKVDVDGNDKPKEAVVIEKAYIEEFKK